MPGVEKLCRSCFVARFPGRRVVMITWGRVCTGCGKPTPSLSTLIKVEGV